MIQIQNINPIDKGDMLASCTVVITPWKMKIHKVIVWQKGENRWVSLPKEKFENRDGEIKYNPIIEWESTAVEKRFRDQVIEAVESYIEKNGTLKTEDVVTDDSEFPF